MEILEYKEIDPTSTRMKLRIGSDEMKKEFDKALGELIKNSEIPGFRPGKAPANIVRRHTGDDEIWQMARDEASYNALEQALKEKESSCETTPEFEHTDYAGEGDYEVEVTYNPGPASPNDESLSDSKGSESHTPKQLKRDQAEIIRRKIKKSPAFEHNKGHVSRVNKGKSTGGRRTQD